MQKKDRHKSLSFFSFYSILTYTPIIRISPLIRKIIQKFDFGVIQNDPYSEYYNRWSFLDEQY